MKTVILYKRPAAISLVMLLVSSFFQPSFAQTTSLWLFDETTALYPSGVLENASGNDYPLVLGLGGKIVPGKFGNALEISGEQTLDLPKGEARFGLTELPPENGRSHSPLSWKTAQFAALMTSGEKHLRNEVGFADATATRLNLGAFDWTVECWLQLLPGEKTNRYLFEVGQGPLLEKSAVTALYLDGTTGDFVLRNDPANTKATIRSGMLTQPASWHHLAFVYNSREQTLFHYVDGKLSSKTAGVKMAALPHGEEAYCSLGRDGFWKQRLNGRIDELKFSEGMVYQKPFALPASASPLYASGYTAPPLKAGLPLLFAGNPTKVLDLGSRKHLFIDSAFVEQMNGLQFTVNPPVRAERVIDNIKSQFRKHLTVVEDEQGVIRIYNGGPDDCLQVFTSKDGVHFDAPDVGQGAFKGAKNVVIPVENGGMGNPFIDPNGAPAERWKYLSDYHRRGVYLYTSADGYKWSRKKEAMFPFRTGSQSSTFYDDQRQTYVSYHRSDLFSWPQTGTRRSSVLTQFKDFSRQADYKSLSQQEYLQHAKSSPLRDPLPWYLDNGPLTPGGFGLEYPRSFEPIREDPSETDIYVAKAQKYAWAPDTYLAFPTVYFHYEDALNDRRRILGEKQYDRGSGPLETQFSVSRDGLHWKRYPRPAYIGIGRHLGRDVKTAYIAMGMVQRGEEIWQYYFGETQYHSTYSKDDGGRGVYRLVQRLDGFVSLDSPYDQEAQLTTKLFTFTGNRLLLNIDTDATGYAQVGFADESGKPVPGFSLDDGIYINGDFISTEAEWAKKGKDVSELQGKPVRLVMRMRGSKLYALQFVNGADKK